MDFVEDIALGLSAGVAYGVVGLVLIIIGYRVLDWLIPGDIGKLIAADKRNDVAIVVGCSIISLGLIVSVAIITAGNDYLKGLVEATGFGLIGVILQGVGFTLANKALPVHLGDALSDDSEDYGIAVVVGAMMIAVGGIVAAAIS